MSSEARLDRLGLSHLSGSALDKALSEQSAGYEKALDEWRKNRSKTPASPKKSAAAAEALAATSELSPTPGAAPLAADASAVCAVPEALAARARAVLASENAAAFLAGFAHAGAGSTAQNALLMALTALEEKDSMTEHALIQIETLRTRAPRPTAPPAKAPKKP